MKASQTNYNWKNLTKINLERYRKVEDAHDVLANAMSDHDMWVDKPNRFEMKHSKCQLGAISVHHLSFGTDTRIEVSDLVDNYYIQLPIHGQLHLYKNDRTVDANPNRAFIMSPGSQHTLEINGNCIQRIIKIPRNIIERQLTDMMKCSIPHPVTFDLDMQSDCGHGASWWRHIQYLVAELGRPDTMYNFKPMANDMGKMIVNGLLHGQWHNYSDALDARSSSIAPGHVHRAETFIKDNIYEDMTIEDIVAAAKVRKRTLYDGFKRFRGISPMCYLHNLRLDMAREELLQPDNDMNITSVAMKLGFNHLGRFSINYKKRFGESPSQTLQKRL